MTPTTPAGRWRNRTAGALAETLIDAWAPARGNAKEAGGPPRDTPLTDDLEPGPAEDRVLEFFDAMCAVHAQAVAIAGGEERHFLIGTRRVCLRFAGPGLPARLTPALEHLAAAPSSGDLIVLLWDSASSGVPPVRSPWQLDAYTPRGDLRGDAGGRLRAGFSLGTCTLSMLDLERGLGLYWIHDARELPPWEVAAPLRTILGWWAADQGAQLAHGAAVGIGEDAVLLVGRGGSGKSTTALACLDRGLRYAGDDYVLLRPDGAAPPTVHSLYRTGKLRPQDLAERLPNLRLRHFTAPDYDKAVLLLGDDHRDLLADGLTVRAIVIPNVCPSGTALRPASAIEVLKALAPTTLFQLPGAGKEALQMMSAIAQNVPGYRLEVGPDLDEVVGAIRSLLTNGWRPHA